MDLSYDYRTAVIGVDVNVSEQKQQENGFASGIFTPIDSEMAQPIMMPFVPNPESQMNETERFVAYNSGFNAGYVRGYYVAVNNLNHRAAQRLHNRYVNRGRGSSRGGRGRGRGRGFSTSSGQQVVFTGDVMNAPVVGQEVANE